MVIDSNTGNPIASHVAAAATVNTTLLSWSPDNTSIVTQFNQTGTPPALQIWDIQNTTERNLPIEEGIANVTWSPDGMYIAANGFSDTIYIWQASNGKLVKKLTGMNSIHSQLLWSPSSDRLVLITNSNAQFWNTPDGTSSPIVGVSGALTRSFCWPTGSKSPLIAWTYDREQVQVQPITS